VARFIAISGAVRDGLAAGGVDAVRIAVAYPGVSARAPEAPRDWRTECGWPAHVVVAGITGPASHERGRDSLVRLLESIPRNALDRLGVIVLGGHAQGAGEIAGVRAFRAGYVHDVARALAGLDLLLHTGGSDGLGTAVVEAMALGVPSIAYDAGGLGEVIDHGVDGVLVPDGDRAAFAARTAELVLDGARRAALGRAGPACARRYAPEVMVDTILRTYRDVLERSGV
jgi:glycosyltransferase involved in cell wall biosynthesis